MPDNRTCLVDPERDCYGLKKAMELEVELDDFRAHNDKSHKEFFDRLAVLEKQDAVQMEQYKNIMEKLSGLTDTLAEMKNDSKSVVEKMSPLIHRVEDLEKKYESINADVKVMKEKPAKRWETLVEKVMWAVAAAVITIILSKIGLV